MCLFVKYVLKDNQREVFQIIHVISNSGDVGMSVSFKIIFLYEIKNLLFEQKTKIDKSLAKLSKKKKKKVKIQMKISNEKRDIITDTNKIQKIIRTSLKV